VAYGGNKVPNTGESAGSVPGDLQVAVNGRTTYWPRSAPSKGRAFRNFELRERLRRTNVRVWCDGCTPGETGLGRDRPCRPRNWTPCRDFGILPPVKQSIVTLDMEEF
jgi:hypothetical protein